MTGGDRPLTPDAFAVESLDDPYDLPGNARERYRHDGFVLLRRVLDPDVLAHYAAEISRLVLAANPEPDPLESRSTYDRAFLQVMNLWRSSDAVARFVMGRRLGGIAARLLGCPGVRLYHDQALYKEPGGGHTPWHADQYYWPLANDRCCTAWIPLQDTPLEMGPLAFAPRSHRLEVCRDVPISDESEERIQAAVEDAGLRESVAPFALGDVSFHAGWTLHRAGPNVTDHPRRVMTVIYLDREMRLAEPINDNQIADRAAWCPGVEVGDVIDSPLNPVIV